MQRTRCFSTEQIGADLFSAMIQAKATHTHVRWINPESILIQQWSGKLQEHTHMMPRKTQTKTSRQAEGVVALPRKPRTKRLEKKRA